MIMRWKHLVGGLALILGVMAGCKQQCFLTEDVYNGLHDSYALPKDLETDRTAGSIVTPNISDKMTSEPATIYNPERPKRYLSLAESFALALENGTIGSANLPAINLTGGPAYSDILPGTPGSQLRGVYGALDTDSIRVYALFPATQSADIDSALSKFDARWTSSFNWSNIDQQFATDTSFLTASQSVTATSSLLKPLPTGGVAGITFSTSYNKAISTGGTSVYPVPYGSLLQFQFEQPLLQGFGVEINQLRPAHPGSLLTPFNTQLNTAVEGILLTRVRYDQSRADFQRTVMNMLLNVETAYWNLYAAYGQLFVREIALRNNLMVWRVTKIRVDAGIKGYNMADLYEAMGQYETSRSDWVLALGQVLENERQLRGLLGMPGEDGCRLVPSDPPNLAPYQPDWTTALQQALTLKPELVIAREQVKATQMNLALLKNQLLPDLRFMSTYGINGQGSRLDGDGVGVVPGTTNTLFNENTFRNMASDHYGNWTLGLQLTVPLGFRDQNAGVREGRLRLAQAYWSLRTDEDKVQRILELQYRNVLQYQRAVDINRTAVEAYNNDLNVRYERVRSGQELAVDTTLNTIRFGTAAMFAYYGFIANYNQALAGLEWAKGTLLERDNVVIAEGPLPNCAQVRAVDHERERNKALILREQAAPLPPAGTVPSVGVSLPELVRTRPEMPKEVFEKLPPPIPSPANQGAQLPPMANPDASKAPVIGTVTFPGPNPGTPGTLQLPSSSAENNLPGTLPRSLSDKSTQ